MAKADVKIFVKLIDLVTPSAKKLASGLKVASDVTKDLSARVDVASDSFQGLAGQIATVVTVGAGLAFIKSSIDAFDELDRSLRNLDSSLVAIGNDTEANRAGFRALAEQLSQNSELSRQQILDAQAVSLSITGSAEATAGLSRVAADFAAATGRDFRDALFGVSKAALGKTEVLQELGIQIDKNDIATRGYRAVVEKLNEQFGGSAQALVQTYGGQLRQLENEFNDLKVEIGEEFAPTLVSAFQTARTALIWLPGFLEETFANIEAVSGIAIEVFKRGGIPGMLLGTAPEALRAAFVAVSDDTKDFADEFAKDLRGAIGKILDERKQVIAEIEKEREFELTFKPKIDIEDLPDDLGGALIDGAEQAAPTVAEKLARNFAEFLEGMEVPVEIKPNQAQMEAVIFDLQRRSQELAAEVAGLQVQFFLDQIIGTTGTDLAGAFAEGLASGNAKGAVREMLTIAGTALGIPFADSIAIALVNMAEDPEFTSKFLDAFTGIVRGLIANVIPQLIQDLIPFLLSPELTFAIAEGVFQLLATLFSAQFWVEMGDNFVKGFRETFGAKGFITGMWDAGELQEVGQSIGAGFTEAARGGTDDMFRQFDEGFRDWAKELNVAIANAFTQGAKNTANAITDALSGKGITSGADIGVRGGGDTFVEDVLGVSFQRGTPFVPRTGLARVHQGEAVIPAAQNPFNHRAQVPEAPALAAQAPTFNIFVFSGGMNELSSVGSRLGLDGRTIDELGRQLRSRGF